MFKWSLSAGKESEINTGHIYLAASKPVLLPVGFISDEDAELDSERDTYGQVGVVPCACEVGVALGSGQGRGGGVLGLARGDPRPRARPKSGPTPRRPPTLECAHAPDNPRHVGCMPMQAARRRALLVIRRQILSYGGGAVTFVPDLARELALLNLENVMRVYRLQNLHWTSVPLQWGTVLPPPPQVPVCRGLKECTGSLYLGDEPACPADGVSYVCIRILGS